MTDLERLRQLVAEIDAKAGDALTLVEYVSDDDDGEAEALQGALEELQAVITTWQQAKGYI